MKTSVVLVCVDEAHVCLPTQWGHEGMREDMYMAPSYLRAQVMATTRAPILAMTASAKSVANSKKDKTEVEEIKDMCSIQYSPTTTIVISPVLYNHIYVKLKKPPVTYGFYGKNSYSFSPKQTGSVHALYKIYLKRFISDIKNNRNPKRAILFVKQTQDLADIEDFLSAQLKDVAITRNPNTCPWVCNSSSTGPITAQKIRERTNQEDSSIYLYITTSVMLFGLNIKDLSIVIMFSPFNSLNSFLQAGGRAGRRQGDGKRKKSVVYLLYNGTDVRKNSPMEGSVRAFCEENTCLKQKIHSLFSLSSSVLPSNNWCCSVCNLDD